MFYHHIRILDRSILDSFLLSFPHIYHNSLIPLLNNPQYIHQNKSYHQYHKLAYNVLDNDIFFYIYLHVLIQHLNMPINTQKNMSYHQHHKQVYHHQDIYTIYKDLHVSQVLQHSLINKHYHMFYHPYHKQAYNVKDKYTILSLNTYLYF